MEIKRINIEFPIRVFIPVWLIQAIMTMLNMILGYSTPAGCEMEVMRHGPDGYGGFFIQVGIKEVSKPKGENNVSEKEKSN